MYRYYFQNLLNGETFYKDEENYGMMIKFINKCKYSKKIMYLGRTKLWG